MYTILRVFFIISSNNNNIVSLFVTLLPCICIYNIIIIIIIPFESYYSFIYHHHLLIINPHTTTTVRTLRTNELEDSKWKLIIAILICEQTWRIICKWCPIIRTGSPKVGDARTNVSLRYYNINRKWFHFILFINSIYSESACSTNDILDFISTCFVVILKID